MLGTPIPSRGQRPAYFQMHPSWTHGLMPASCVEHGCHWGMIGETPDGRMAFVHDAHERFSSMELDKQEINDLDYDIWGDRVRPWIERLHSEVSV